MKFELKILVAILLIFPVHVGALESSATVKVTPLLKTTRSWDGKAIVYPFGEAEITGLMVEIAPRGETGWHKHPVPSFGMVLQGKLEVTLENGQVKHLKAGDALAEVVNTLHNGRNRGKQPIKMVVFYAGTTNTAPTVTNTQITKSKTENTTLKNSDAINIDNILRLIDDRLALAPKVAMAKWNSGGSIDDPVREAQVLSRMHQQATLLNIDPALTIYFFQSQMKANKLYQQRLHDQWQQTAQPSFVKVPDLVLEVRPVIDALQTKLLIALKDVQRVNFNADTLTYLHTRANQLIRNDFNDEVSAIALSPLLEKIYFSEH